MLLTELIHTKDRFDLIRLRVLPVAFLMIPLLGIGLLVWEPFPAAAGIAIITLSPILYFWPLACKRWPIFHRYLLEAAVSIDIVLLASFIGALHIRIFDTTWTFIVALALLAALAHQFILYRIRTGRKLHGLQIESALNWYLLAVKDQEEESIAGQLREFYFLSESITKYGLIYSRNHVQAFEPLYQDYLRKMSFLETAWTDRWPQWMLARISSDR